MPTYGCHVYITLHCFNSNRQNCCASVLFFCFEIIWLDATEMLPMYSLIRSSVNFSYWTASLLQHAVTGAILVIEIGHNDKDNDVIFTHCDTHTQTSVTAKR